nr:NAD(P)-binding domain-containing protein [Carbonactinospora thermoautotrophica]
MIDASGTYATANPLGAGGLPARGEAAARAAGHVVPALPDVLGADRERFAGTRTLVVGVGHSAANTLLALVVLARTEPGTEVWWAIRKNSPARLYGDADGLPARGRPGTALKAAVESGQIRLVRGFVTTALTPRPDGTVEVVGATPEGEQRLVVHTVVAATGFRSDLSITSEIRLGLDPALECPAALAELIDPNFHSCGTVRPHGERELAHPEPGFYVVGMKSYGRAPTFLLATGYEQARSVVAALAGDREAADRVELDLPETGVCSSTLADLEDAEIAGATAGGCCGRPAREPVSIGFATGHGGGWAAEVTGQAKGPEQAEPAGCCG